MPADTAPRKYYDRNADRQSENGGNMVVKINRLFHGFASVRDYQVKACQDAHQDLCIDLHGEIMVVPYQELGNGFTNNDVFLSKHTDKSYTLVDYDWKPNGKQLTFL